MAVAVKNVVYCDMTAVGVLRFIVTGNVLTSPILVTLMMEAMRSSETSVVTRATSHPRR
jgi:hypothetical protein